jgi:hypothetical protein
MFVWPDLLLLMTFKKRMPCSRHFLSADLTHPALGPARLLAVRYWHEYCVFVNVTVIKRLPNRCLQEDQAAFFCALVATSTSNSLAGFKPMADGWVGSAIACKDVAKTIPKPKTIDFMLFPFANDVKILEGFETGCNLKLLPSCLEFVAENCKCGGPRERFEAARSHHALSSSYPDAVCKLAGQRFDNTCCR